MTLDHPWALVAGIAPAALLAWALIRPGRRERVVGSLLIWKRAMARTADRRSPAERPPAAVWAGLAAAALLVAAWAGPVRTPETGGRRLRVVLDCSAAMQGRRADGGTRFEAARGRCLALLAELAPADRVELLVPGREAVTTEGETVEAGLLTPTQAAARIRALVPVPTDFDWEGDLRRRGLRPMPTVVFSGRAPVGPAPSGADGGGTALIGAGGKAASGATWVDLVGGVAGDLAIAHVGGPDYEAVGPAGGEAVAGARRAVVCVTVRNVGSVPMGARLAFRPVPSGQHFATDASTPWPAGLTTPAGAEPRVRLAPGAMASLNVVVGVPVRDGPPGTTGEPLNARMEVRLVHDDPALDGREDNDRRVVWLEPARRLAVWLIGPDGGDRAPAAPEGAPRPPAPPMPAPGDSAPRPSDDPPDGVALLRRMVELHPRTRSAASAGEADLIIAAGVPLPAGTKAATLVIGPPFPEGTASPGPVKRRRLAGFTTERTSPFHHADWADLPLTELTPLVADPSAGRRTEVWSDQGEPVVTLHHDGRGVPHMMVGFLPRREVVPLTAGAVVGWARVLDFFATDSAERSAVPEDPWTEGTSPGMLPHLLRRLQSPVAAPVADDRPVDPVAVVAAVEPSQSAPPQRWEGVLAFVAGGAMLAGWVLARRTG